MKHELSKYPPTLTDFFMKTGIKAKHEGKTFDQAAEQDEDALFKAAKDALGTVTQWDAMILGTAYKLGYETARP